MERNEPVLVPEWLRCTANVAAGTTCSPNSDVSPTWNTQRAAYLERNHSSNSRRSSSSSSNDSTKHPYSSFNTSHRERNNKDRSASGDISLENILELSVKNNSLRCSQSLVSRRTSEVVPLKTEDLKNNGTSAKGSILGRSNLSRVHKVAFDKDFPYLGNEGSGIGKVSSPVQSLPIATAGLLGGEKWTSALAGIPSMIANTSNGSSTSGASTAATLNMAEALSQVPQRGRAIPQALEKAVRLEELAIKQSRQLIPMIPSMPKTSVLIPSEKSKQPKAAVRSNEAIVPVRSLQQPQQNYSSQVSNQPRGGQVRSDASNASQAGGKFLVLKAAREHITNSSVMDASYPANNGNSKPANNQFSQPPSAIAVTSNVAPKASTLDKKTASLSLNSKHTPEKKSSLSQAQSRSDFFNLMRKKTFLNTSSAVSDSSSTVLSHTNKVDGHIKEAESAPTTFVTRSGDQMIGNGDSYGPKNGGQSFTDNEDKNLGSHGDVYPDEEEAAFLRSLGWEENGEEVEITDEEIVAFYEEYQKFVPSLKVWRSIQPKCLMLPEFHSSKSVAASSKSGYVGSEFDI